MTFLIVLFVLAVVALLVYGLYRWVVGSGPSGEHVITYEYTPPAPRTYTTSEPSYTPYVVSSSSSSSDSSSSSSSYSSSDSGSSSSSYDSGSSSSDSGFGGGDSGGGGASSDW